MAQVLGIIGGGQLGMMLTEAAKKMSNHISDVTVLDPTENCPAAKAGAKQIVADFKDESAIVELSKRTDIITYEIELGNSNVLKKIESKTQVSPSPETLKIIQDKLTQKKFLHENNLPIADFVEIDSLEDVSNKINQFGFPALLKARFDSYDGRGNFKINSKNEIETAYKYFNEKPLFLEKFIDFAMEISVIAARNTKGDIAVYSPVENIHEDNILRMTIAPARISQKISKDAEDIARTTMQVLKGAGVFGIEMFVTKDDKILINEIAPRVHNSGHHTLQSSKTSQFEQHLRAILGLELGSTELLYPTIMYNILGPKTFEGKYKPVTLPQQKGIFLKMYGKEETKPKRKLGHINIVAQDRSASINDLLNTVEQLKRTLAVQPVV